MPLAKDETESPQLRLLKALAHPTRLKILGVLAARDISPAEYARENREDVSNVAYHFRQLKKFGCIEVVDTKPARGSTEHFHRSSHPVVFDDEIWRSMPPAMHASVSYTILENLFGRLGEAFRAGTFDKRLDRHFTWMPMVVDEDGWTAMTSILGSAFEELLDVNEEASERLAKTGEPGIEATAALIGFESPPRRQRS
jgi:DNA-binding transcriptional ArsR family regulator